MRERERLEDFQGGHVACRGCKRLIYFAPQTLHLSPLPVLCCNIAYVPTQHQVDLLIYDKLQPGDITGAIEMPGPGAVVIPPGDPEEADLLPVRQPLGDDDESDDPTPALWDEVRMEMIYLLPERDKIERLAFLESIGMSPRFSPERIAELEAEGARRRQAVLDYAAMPALSDEPFPGVEDESYEPTPTDEAELETLVVTPAQALERKKERVAEMKRRGRIDYGS